MKPRKPPGPHLASRDIDRFNEAAAMKPRKRGARKSLVSLDF
jgi:hypothetical protein